MENIYIHHKSIQRCGNIESTARYFDFSCPAPNIQYFLYNSVPIYWIYRTMSCVTGCFHTTVFIVTLMVTVLYYYNGEDQCELSLHPKIKLLKQLIYWLAQLQGNCILIGRVDCMVIFMYPIIAILISLSRYTKKQINILLWVSKASLLRC